MIQTLRELFKYLLPYKLNYLLGIGLLALTAAFDMFNPKILGMTIDKLNSNPRSGLWEWLGYDGVQNADSLSQSINLNAIYFYGALILGIMLIKGIILYYSRYILIGDSRRIEYDFRMKLFNHLLALEPEYFDKNKTGDLISRLTSDLEQIRMIFGPGIMYSFNVAFLFLFALFNMISIDTTLTLLAIIPLFFLVYIIKTIGKKYYNQSRIVQEEIANMTAFVNENLQGIRVIKSYVKESFVLGFFQKINLEYLKKNLRLAKLNGALRPAFVLIAGVSTVIILLYGGQAVMNQTMTLGQLIEFFRYIERLGMPLMAMGWVISIYQRGTAAYSRITKILETEAQITDKQAHDYINSLQGNIELRSLSFAYDNRSHSALDNITFEIKKGEHIAIIGPTGSGKTTLISLLLRLYEAPDHSILIDGTPIQHIPIKVLRKHFTCVSQENFIFPDSVLENIQFGATEEKDMKEIIDVASIAQFDIEIESFPDGYHEMIGERGMTLSGGQKQRLGIARVLTAEPKVFIFDDSFSNIDSGTEKRILASIYRSFKDETIIMIANRVSTIQHMDRIIVLDHGRIREMGTPEELILNNDYYARLLQRERLSHNLNDLL